MIKSSTGVYIASKNVDIVELIGSINAPRLLNFVRTGIQSPPAAAGQTEVKQKDLRQEAVSLAIKEGFEKLGIRPSGVHTVLLSSEVMIRNFTMPQLPGSEQQQALKFEARKYIPFKMDEIISDFRIVAAPRPHKAVNVYFIAATKAYITSTQDICKNAGTDAFGIDIIPFALVRILLLAKKISVKENAAILYIDNDKESASIHIVEAGMPFLSRDFAISIDDKDALFEKLVSELRVSLDYYNRQASRPETTKIIVCGETPFAGIGAYISDELKIITEMIEAIPGMTDFEKMPASAIIAAGTAMGGLGRSRYSVNLSPIAAVVKKKAMVNYIILTAAAALFVIIFTFTAANIAVRSTMARLIAIKEKGRGLPASTANKDSVTLEALKKKKWDEAKTLQILVNDRISWAQKFDRIAKNISDSVWIDNIYANEKTTLAANGFPSGFLRGFSITGNAFSTDSAKETAAITKFFTALKDDKTLMSSIKGVELGSIEKKRIADCWISSFSITAGKEAVEKEGSKWRRR